MPQKESSNAANLDYSALGVRIGLEVHQQLDAGQKLFCKCPIAKSEEFPIAIKRKMRVVPSELGEYDPAAVYEFLRNKTFIYRANSESSCLLEADEEPPHPMNENALRIALQICKLLRADVVDELHVMRKTVIDGSAVSGFQRTALLATNGEIDTPSGALPVRTIMIEEDSAPPVSQREDVIEYRLDRLGIPLVEIATSSDIHAPQQAKEAAAAIGMLLRSVAVVRGIGSIRQDINISIRNGSRIEIKGFQELEKISAAVENEIRRQVALLEIKDELLRRGFRGAETADVTSIFKNTKNNLLRKKILDNGKVIAIKAPCFASLLAKRAGDRTFGKELSAYAEAYGSGIMHSDEDLEKHGISNEFRELRKRLAAGEQDAIIIMAGRGLEAATAALIDRINHCAKGVPEETRVSDGEGSRYTRPLPGSGRLYPESDIPAIRITKQFLKSVSVPKTLEERKLALSLPKELAEQIIRSPYLELYEELKNYGAVLVAGTLLSLTALRREGTNVDNIQKSDMEKIFAAVSKNKLPKDSVLEAMKSLAAGEQMDKILEKYKPLTDDELAKIVKEAVKVHSGKKESVLMGIIMAKVRGSASGERVAKLLRREM